MKGNVKNYENFFAADGRRQKLDSILYRLPTWHPIYSMPFGQSDNVTYSPVRAESFGPPLSAGQKNRISCLLLSALSSEAGGKILVMVKPD